MGNTHLCSASSVCRAPPAQTKHTPRWCPSPTFFHIQNPSLWISSSLIVSTPLHRSPKFYLNCYLLTLMTKLNKTPIQQALMHPLHLKYARGPLNLSEVQQHVGKCRVRTKAEHKVLLLGTAMQSYVALLYSQWQNLICCFSTGTSVRTPLTLSRQVKPQCSLYKWSLHKQ